MNMNDGWEELVERHLRNELTEPEMEQLAEWLDSTPEARQAFVEEALWDTRLAEVLQTTAPEEPSTPHSDPPASDGSRQAASTTLLRLMLAGAIAVIVLLSVGLYQQQTQTRQRIAAITAVTLDSTVSPPIARVVGVSGSLIWTGDRGRIQRTLEPGTELPGGTIEGVGPDSWFELQFNDGSTVMISGTSMLTFADAGQKVLRLKEGRLSASVEPQPAGHPMLIYTHTALLQVLGTQFDVQADLATTTLNVSEGQVRVRRLSDRGEVDVPARHRLITEADNELLPEALPDATASWKSQISLQPESYGKWQPATGARPASLKAIPLTPPKHPDITLYLAGLSVHNSNGSPVVVQPGSRFAVRGRLKSPAPVYFGIRVARANGEFAGMFRGDLHNHQPPARTDENGYFEEVYSLSGFSTDPAVMDRRDELAKRPDGLVLTGVWAFTHTGSPSGLEIIEVELIPPPDSEASNRP